MKWRSFLPAAELTTALVVLLAAYLGLAEIGWVTWAPAGEETLAPVGDGAAGGEDGRIITRVIDPIGDDRGPGSYAYPTNPGFAPGKGLFDLLSFTVREKGENVYFDLEFGAVTNPWRAPEGFFHQRVDVFIDAVSGAGRTTLVEDGASVQFCAEHPWDLWLRGEPWGGSALLDAEGRVLGDVTDGKAAVEVLPDARTIRWRIARTALGKEPRPGWWYYVLVGGYDTFGPSRYRAVFPKASEWYFGGGGAAMLHPLVIDVLALARGPRSQKAQLTSYSTARRRLATLYPVSAGSGKRARAGVEAAGRGGDGNALLRPLWVAVMAGLVFMLGRQALRALRLLR